MLEPKILTGSTECHLTPIQTLEEGTLQIHRDSLSDFLALQNEARKAGFDLQILSGFRSFEAQLSIWNRKATGQRAVLDESSTPIDISTLNEEALMWAILRWSALPGASRHHWGTDLDVYDANSRPEGYEIQLVPEEVNSGCMFGAFHDWLDEQIRLGSSHGFFRPYQRDLGGVAPERWHLSHSPISRVLLRELTLDRLRERIETSPIELKNVILDHLESIYKTYVLNIEKEPPYEHAPTS